MITLKVRVEDGESNLTLPLSAEAAILVGRDPNVSRIDAALREQFANLPVKAIAVPSQRVSANHFLVRLADDVVMVWDLNSRNGTWARLPPGQPVSISGATTVSIDLARAAVGSFTMALPQHAEWTSEGDYARGVVKAVASWLEACRVPARVFSSASERHQAHPDMIPLADGSYLHVLPPDSMTFEVSWRSVIDRVRDYANAQNTRFEQLQGHDEDFILASPVMREVHRQIVDAAAYGMRLMILGPTGAGKERLARCFHNHSRQHRGPYATVNCALLQENLLYAQLFGARRGSFTGAVQDVVGVVEAAHEGTLFLDEVGEMDIEVQKALLRFLDSRGEYRRLGDTTTRKANVQIVCATNQPLDSATERRGRFRDDLWYRLGVKVVWVPPVSQRREDILAFLGNRFLRGGQVRVLDALTPAALQLILQDPWPGNFRDLENFVERLPPASQIRQLDEATCKTALSEGRRPEGHSVGPSPASPPMEEASWQSITSRANAAFEEDYGGPPTNWGQIQIHNEKYLKPVFIAQSCGLTEVDELNKSINYSGLARRLNIADGTTVKMHLARYVERFRKKPAAPSE